MTTWTWFAPDGSQLRFCEPDPAHGDSVEVRDLQGDGVPAQQIEQSRVYAGGSRVTGAWITERSMAVTVGVEARLSRFVEWWREVSRSITSTRVWGEGQFRITADDGSWRELKCRYASGLEDGYSDGALLGYAVAVVEFLAVDPYWYGPTTQVLEFGYGETVDFLDPFLSLSPPGRLGEQSVTIDGDSEGWPVWTFRGSFTSVTLTSRDRSFTVLGPPSGSLVLTTDPRNRSLLTGSGVSAFEFLERPADIWSLLPGEQNVMIDMAGGSAGASVELTYRPRWQTP